MSEITLLALGMFTFGMDTLAYSEFQRRTDWRHGKADRHGARPASQYLGPGEDKVTLSGVLAPELAGKYSSIETLREMASSGDAWPLVDGAGTVLGTYRIMAVDERQAAHIPGGFARKIDFAVDLDRAD